MKKGIKQKLNKSIYIIISSLLLALSVCFVDAIIQPNYFIKCIVKVIFYLLIPTTYFIINKDEFNEFKKMFKPNKKDFKKTILLSISIYLIIVFGYFIIRNFLDFSKVTSNLIGNMGIDLTNYLYVTLYIAFLNSFLEEFFYRGYAFITLKKHTSRLFAYIYSSTIFAFYHIGMMLESFYLPTLILATISLFIAGCIFNYFNEKANNIYPSWIFHMFINFGLNTVGLILFLIS